MLTINEYRKPFDDSIKELIEVLGKVYISFKGLSETDISLNDFDYDAFIKKIEDTIQLLKMKRCRYKFNKMNEKEFEQFLRTDKDGNLSITKEHIIRQYDTLQSISKEHGVPIVSILDYNNMMKQDFEDKRERREKILIPITIKAKERTVFENLSVFDSHCGKSAWGRDISNTLETEDGRLKVLNNDETLSQSLMNLLGDYGSIPFYEELTLNADWGNDLPKDFLELYTRIKIERRFELDPRVQKVIDVKSSKSDCGLNFEVSLYPINVPQKKENEVYLLAG